VEDEITLPHFARIRFWDFSHIKELEFSPLKAVYVKKVLAMLDEIEALDEADEPEEGEIEDDE
jgi:hypothetical protein